MKKALFYGILLLLLFFVGSNLYMVYSGNKRIVADEELRKAKADCILVLGAGVYKDGRPSPMLRDRLEEGIRLYKEGFAPKVIVSGDHGQDHYDETNVMKRYMIEAGVPSKDVFMDHAGFITYDSMYRARDVFGVKKPIVVTQEYHMYRALYICDSLGLDAYGAPAAKIDYVGATMRTIREWLAREKAILYCLTKQKPRYLGEKIDIGGNGDVTND